MSLKRKKILLIVLSILLAAALIGLGAQSFLTSRDRDEQIPSDASTEAPTAPPTQAPTDAPTEVPTETPTEAPTQAPTEPVPAFTNPLSGEAMEAPLTNRIFMVSVNNSKDAMPQHGISQAEIYYEMLVEGSSTRCLAVFSDIASVEKLGAVRSARIYTVSLTQCYDAILCHAGGSDEAESAIRKRGVDDIDAVLNSGGAAYYRDSGRRSAGYSLEHTLFTGSDRLIANATDRGLALEREEPYDFGLTFAADATPNGEAAASINFAFGNDQYAKTTAMHYDGETGKYTASQYKTDWIDGNTGNPLAFENVLLLYAKTSVQSDGVHKTIELVGEGDGLFACNGKIIPIKWSRSADEAPFVYTLEDGSPLTLGVGTTYIGILPTGAAVSYE